MDNQEAFSRIVQYLRWQGGRSMNAEGKCRYRDPITRRRCAVGVLLTDEFYSEDIEGSLATDLKDLLTRALPGVSSDLLTSCQYVHDIGPFMLWEKMWEEVARRFGLVVPKIEGGIESCVTPVTVEAVCAL